MRFVVPTHPGLLADLDLGSHHETANQASIASDDDVITADDYLETLVDEKDTSTVEDDQVSVSFDAQTSSVSSVNGTSSTMAILMNTMTTTAPPLSAASTSATGTNTTINSTARPTKKPAKPIPWPVCQETLWCTFSVLRGVNLQDHLVHLWRAVEDMYQFFIDKGLASPNSTLSFYTSAITEGIQRGAAIALGHTSDTFGNPSAALWGRLIKDTQSDNKKRKYKNRAVHDRAWSLALMSGFGWAT
ncbi:hypothetical protein B0H66DRAFT_641317 [Apodospora peruviana]|uniref:Uncharacterized protein n=1 Tax=Apodospora peruviana TaxID=516989 RepID=A0AAE0I0X4_9PEZI|nr:hypothetical protein B0H66DRAFT_641317 [Apodospora peruviana]